MSDEANEIAFTSRPLSICEYLLLGQASARYEEGYQQIEAIVDLLTHRLADGSDESDLLHRPFTELPALYKRALDGIGQANILQKLSELIDGTGSPPSGEFTP